MAVRLSALRTGRPLLLRNIIFLLLVSISVRGFNAFRVTSLVGTAGGGVTCLHPQDRTVQFLHYLTVRS
jgi:hypothetical protein